MGMYTEVYINVNLVENVPDDVLDVLEKMCDYKESHEEFFDQKGHPVKWDYLFCDGSYYTPRTCCHNLTFDKIANTWSLLGKGDLKNYDNEIEKFFEWIDPYVAANKGEFIGYYQYETEESPTLVYKQAMSKYDIQEQEEDAKS